MAMLSALEVPKSSYFSWLRADRSEAMKRHANELALVKKAFYELRSNAGTRPIKAYLERHESVVMSRRKIKHLMAEAGLFARRSKRFKPSSSAPISDERIKPDLVGQQFNIRYLNQVFVGDITYLKTTHKPYYLAVYLDVCSRRVVGWELESNMKATLVVNALSRALTARKTPDKLIVHTDQGSQFISDKYRRLLDKQGIRQSMSRRGNCWDNSVIESFFKTLKAEVIYQLNKRPTPTELKFLIADFIGYYNYKRPHSYLGYLSPVEYEEKLKRPALKII